MNNLLFLDTETTGKDETARLVQLCYKLPDKDPETELFKPPLPITFEAMATHHITEDMVKNMPVFTDSLMKKELSELLTDHILVAHNAPFDIAILEREGLKVPRFIDTLRVCQHLFDETQYKLQYLRYKYDLKIGGKAHDAEGDVLVLEALFIYIFYHMPISKMEFERVIEEMEILSKTPVLLRRINFGKYKGMDFNKLPNDYMQWLRKQSDLDADLIYTLDYYLNPHDHESPVPVI